MLTRGTGIVEMTTSLWNRDENEKLQVRPERFVIDVPEMSLFLLFQEDLDMEAFCLFCLEQHENVGTLEEGFKTRDQILMKKESHLLRPFIKNAFIGKRNNFVICGENEDEITRIVVVPGLSRKAVQSVSFIFQQKSKKSQETNSWILRHSCLSIKFSLVVFMT